MTEPNLAKRLSDYVSNYSGLVTDIMRDEPEPNYDDLVTDIMRYESGEMPEGEAVEFFSRLFKSGMLPHLQGSYQRGFYALQKIGYLSPEGDVLIEVYEGDSE